jgi:hypothetical protein
MEQLAAADPLTRTRPVIITAKSSPLVYEGRTFGGDEVSTNTLYTAPSSLYREDGLLFFAPAVYFTLVKKFGVQQIDFSALPVGGQKRTYIDAVDHLRCYQGWPGR